MMRNGKKSTLDFYTSLQPTNYEKKERNKKKPSTGGGSAGAASVSMDDLSRSSHLSFQYGWKDN